MNATPVARSILIGLLIVATGCYQYVPVSPAEVAPEAEVRVRLSLGGVQRFRRPLVRDLEQLEGRLVRWDPDVLTVHVPTEVHTAGFPPTTSVEVIELASSDVGVVERKKLHTWRTVGLVAAIVGGTVAAVFGTRIVGGGQDDPEPPPDPRQSIRIPIF
ncbi:MAG: hypothetical protein ACREMJ_00310 [Gemmatimonadales bacterium]